MLLYRITGLSTMGQNSFCRPLKQFHAKSNSCQTSAVSRPRFNSFRITSGPILFYSTRAQNPQSPTSLNFLFGPRIKISLQNRDFKEGSCNFRNSASIALDLWTFKPRLWLGFTGLWLEDKVKALALVLAWLGFGWSPGLYDKIYIPHTMS